LPFDATPQPPEAVQVIDDLMAFFGPDGDRWIRGHQWDKSGNRCLWGALRSSKLSLKARRQAEGFIVQELRTIDGVPSSDNREIIMTYNDCCAEDYEALAAMLRLVREEIMSRKDQLELTV
jgi:hypothetical protein